jgi:hypothetical protein
MKSPTSLACLALILLFVAPISSPAQDLDLPSDGPGALDFDLRSYDLPSAEEIGRLSDWANGQRTFIDDYGVYYMTQQEYDAMQAERQAVRQSFADADKHMEPAREQAKSKLQGYAIGLAVMGLVFCCQCRNWFGKVLILAIFLAGAVWLYDVSEQKPAPPESYEPARITITR